MRTKNPELMEEIKNFIESYYFENGKSPSTTKIADAVGISRGGAYKYLVSMRDKGMISYQNGIIETTVTRKYNKSTSTTAIVGSIPCGIPEYEEENIEEYVSLPTALFGTGEFFILRASGSSMIEAGIEDGDFVVIRKQLTAKEGDIVVALVDNQNTLKTFYKDKKHNKVILHPENKEMEDIVVDNLIVQGVACNVIKQL